jgi:cell division protein FtsI (penicillin-binding protein 3)
MENPKKKNAKKKSFFFEDYTETKIINGSNTTKSIKISLSRVTILFFIFLSLIFIFCLKIFYLSLFPEKNIFSYKDNLTSPSKRADIIDRSGVILARSVNIYRAGIKPKFIKDKEKFLINLRLKFPELDSDEIKKKLSKEKFFYLGNGRFTEEKKDKLWSLGLSKKVLELQKKQYRIYPQKNLFSHVLGQTDDENFGISGVEMFFDKELKDPKFVNSPLTLTLDTNLQYLIREELINAETHFNTIGAAALLMDVKNGEILSLISLPDYNLNNRLSISEDKFTNKITKGVYELGSVFKTFTVAAGLENKKIKSNTIFKNLERKLNCGKHTVSEHDLLPKNLSVEQILIRSSNIGSVKIVQKVGTNKYRKFLDKLELLEKINFELEEVTTPLNYRWGKCELLTASYGQGITTTLLQLAKAYAILGNGGYKIKPHILKKVTKTNKKLKKIVSTETSDAINSILRKVVSEKEGTANFANVEGYEVSGKTGTAYKLVNGAYDKRKKRNTFVSLFPSSEPKYVLLIMLDEPKPAPEFVYDMPPTKKFPNGYKYSGEIRNTSGWNTVVVAGKIIEKIGPILAINNLQASTNF